MGSFKLVDRRAGSLIAAIALVFATVAPTIAGAAHVTESSIALTSSSKSASDVTYTVNFTADGGAAAFVVDFCDNTPVIGQACDTPEDFSATGVTSTTSGFTGVNVLDANTLVVTAGTAIEANQEVSVALDGFTNPSVSGPVYARVVTYSDAVSAAAYQSTNLGSNVVDTGSVAISITDTIGVSGAVLETMTFCVSGAEIEENCTGTTAPTVTLGETVGSTTALIASAVSEGTIHTQISTNAATGAVVSLKSSALSCGGLVRAGAPASCDIAPALNDGITAGQARFGVKTSTATNTSGFDGAVGEFAPVADSGYNALTFALNFNEDNSTGVTSPFGDLFLDTAGKPANNKNMALTFGASVSNSTPAGLYSADLSLIATGRF